MCRNQPFPAVQVRQSGDLALTGSGKLLIMAFSYLEGKMVQFGVSFVVKSAQRNKQGHRNAE
jgi:hypothetical protein